LREVSEKKKGGLEDDVWRLFINQAGLTHELWIINGLQVVTGIL
jgi:hypothetical protein